MLANWKFSLSILISAFIISGCSTFNKQESPQTKLPGWTWACHNLGTVKDAKYCVHIKGEPDRTIFYFHGVLSSQDLFVGEPSPILSWLSGGKKGESEVGFLNLLDNVAVVTYSFDAAWLISPYSPRELGDRDSTIDAFINKAIPEIESGVPLPRPFFAVGHSAGGFNVAELILARPELFKAAAMIHPMIATCDLYAGEFLNESCWPDELIRREFPKEKYFSQVDPLMLAKHAKSVPRSLVVVCEKDQFKLIDGPKQFAKTLMGKGFHVTLDDQNDCSHYNFSAQRIVDFLGQPDPGL